MPSRIMINHSETEESHPGTYSVYRGSTIFMTAGLFFHSSYELYEGISALRQLPQVDIESPRAQC
jgi:hypothetical protein